MQKFIVVRNNQIIRVYETKEGIEGNYGIKQALKNACQDFKDVSVIEKLDDFEYAEGDMIYPYNPKDKRPQVEVIEVHPDVAG